MKVSIDTRTLKPGDIFIPIKGARYDGHDFIEEAKKKGALRILEVDLSSYAREYRKNFRGQVIAITGSSGKTTVKDLLASVLAQKYVVHKTRENFNNEVGVPLTILGIEPETEIAIVEMGMRQLGEIRQLVTIAAPTHCVITNIGKTHLASLKTQKNIARAKAEIFTRLPCMQKWPKRQGYFAENIKYRNLLLSEAKKNNLNINLVPKADALEANIVLVREIASSFGLNAAEIATGLLHYQPSLNRQEIFRHKNITLINDAYNSNPDAMEYALKQLDLIQGRKILILGDMLELGALSKKEHIKLGLMAAQFGINIILALGKETHHIKISPGQVLHFATRVQLEAKLQALLQAGDVVLFKASRKFQLEQSFLVLKNFLLHSVYREVESEGSPKVRND